MKEKDPWKELFEPLQGQWDTEEPLEGHQNRFEARLMAAAELKNQEEEEAEEEPRLRPLWSKNIGWRPLAVAASLALLIGLGVRLGSGPKPIQEQIVEFAPEVQETDFHFASLLERQVETLESMASEDNQELIEATMQQLQRLDADYQVLQQELVDGGNTKLLLQAMVINFQTRIDLVQQVIEQIEQYQLTKTLNDENFTI
jgi:hypothetical protein